MTAPGRHRLKKNSRVTPFLKLVTAACGLIALALANGLLHGRAAAGAWVLLSLATLAGIYKVPNKATR